MAQQSAGLLMYRRSKDTEFFLIHPGGPFWKNKQAGAWSIPKGLCEPDEDPLFTAQREFKEETGIQPTPPFHPVGTCRLKSGKIIEAWAFEGEWNPATGITSNNISVEWPPRSGKFISIPEADQGAWMRFEEASTMINPGQLPILQRAVEMLTP